MFHKYSIFNSSGNTMALFFYQKRTCNCNQTHGRRNDKNEPVATRSVENHSTHVGPKSDGQLMHGGDKPGQQAQMRQTIQLTHQCRGQWCGYEKCESEQEGEDIEIGFIRIFQFRNSAICFYPFWTSHPVERRRA